MTTTLPTLAQWQRGLEILERIVELENELASLIGKPVHARITIKQSAPSQIKLKRSPETIAKMKAAQKKRWAKAKAPASAKAPAKKSRGMSAAGRAAIVAAQKARWAEIKAEKASVAFKAPAKAPAKAPLKKRKISAEVSESLTKRWTYSKPVK